LAGGGSLIALIALIRRAMVVAQFVGLERRTSRSGRDSVDHAPGAHDDVANAVAGALVTKLDEPMNVTDKFMDEFFALTRDCLPLRPLEWN
jgi:hypothetical protein